MLPNTYRHLTHIRKGAFGEAYAKMAFALSGFEVLTPEWDDHGVDFVVKKGGRSFYEVQVKTTDSATNPYVYKDNFQCSRSFILAAVRLVEGVPPNLFLARGSDWNKNRYRCLYHNVRGGKAGPYYELRLSKAYKNELERFQFANYIKTLK